MKEYYARRAAEYDATSWEAFEEAEREAVARFDQESWELRRLLDGSEHRVFKRYLTAGELARELDGVVVLASAEFVAVRAPVVGSLSRRAG